MTNQFIISFRDLSDEMQNEIRNAIHAYLKDDLIEECENFKSVNGDQYKNTPWRKIASILYGIEDLPAGLNEDFALDELLEEWTEKRINESSPTSVKI